MISGIIKEPELQNLNNQQIIEIQRYRWYLGEQLCHDPLLDMSLDQICLQWITLYAKKFRLHWCHEHGILCNSSGECNGECYPS